MHRLVTQIQCNLLVYITLQHGLKCGLRYLAYAVFPQRFLLCKFNSAGSFLPAPQMSTVLPRVTPALRQAWIPTDKGSIRAPSSNVTLSGNLLKNSQKRRSKTEITQRLRKQVGSC